MCVWPNRESRGEYLNDVKNREFMALLDDFFDSMVEVPRLKHGDKQSFTSLINEKVQLLAKYLRGEKANARVHEILRVHSSLF